MEMEVEADEWCCVPPGFRFHPTEEELVGYYLARKVASQQIDLDIIQEVDLYRIEPWDLQERCSKYGGGGMADEQQQQTTTEWYFFSYKDRKYPSGTRTNRATAAGFWKATGRDKPVLSSRCGRRVIGMRKTLVFYKGRAPNGTKTHWIMHEYRLHHEQSTDHHDATATSQGQAQLEEGWVVCRAFQKPIPNQTINISPSSFFPTYYDGDHHHFLASLPAAALLQHPPPSSSSSSSSSSLFPHLHQAQLYSSDHHHHHLLIPQQLDQSPTAGGTDNEQQPQPASAIDWNFLDTSLSTTTAHASPYVSSSTLPPCGD